MNVKDKIYYGTIDDIIKALRRALIEIMMRLYMVNGNLKDLSLGMISGYIPKTWIEITSRYRLLMVMHG